MLRKIAFFLIVTLISSAYWTRTKGNNMFITDQSTGRVQEKNEMVEFCKEILNFFKYMVELYNGIDNNFVFNH